MFKFLVDLISIFFLYRLVFMKHMLICFTSEIIWAKKKNLSYLNLSHKPFCVVYFSIGWLRLLHHCLTHISDLEGMMASAAAPTANLLQTCAALLMSPYCGMHSPNIEVVLVKIGLQSTRIGLKLIDILLRNCAASGSDPTGEQLTLIF